MPIEPPEILPATPGNPAEPPQESPPGSPRPEVPPPVQEPGEPARPEELPGRVPEELPVRGPQGPRTPPPAADLQGRKSDPNPGISNMSQRTMWNFGLKRSPECVMNKHLTGPCAFRNKYQPAFEGRHNPA
jgi:hypothetical protein